MSTFWRRYFTPTPRAVQCLKKILDPDQRIFSRLNQLRTNNYFRFRSYGEFWTWLQHINDGKKLYRQINFNKIAPEATLVILNNFNRHTSLVTLIDWLRTLDDKVAILLLDNGSTYPPLLRFYQEIEGAEDLQILYLGYNSRLRGLAQLTPYLSQLTHFIVSDTDLVPYSTTPKDIISHMSRLLAQYPAYEMVGASLEIEDIPDYYPAQEEVMGWESKFWQPQTTKLNNEVLVAAVDTTFAMYRNHKRVMEFTPSLRMDRPYTLQHLDWYVDPRQLTEEYQYYVATCCPEISTWNDPLRRVYRPLKPEVVTTRPIQIEHPALLVS